MSTTDDGVKRLAAHIADPKYGHELVTMAWMRHDLVQLLTELSSARGQIAAAAEIAQREAKCEIQSAFDSGRRAAARWILEGLGVSS